MVAEYVAEVCKAADELGGEEGKDAAKRLLSAAHDLKGMGGTFGYDLLTNVSDNLCKFLRKNETLDAKAIGVARIHADTIRVVVADKIKGDGGEHGREILAGLERLC